MDVQEHKTISSSEHEIHSVHHCHKCGWPFPNPHPSARHRRAHKRVCGTIEGYRLIDSGPDHANLAGSDNEHISDDEGRNPSPNVDKGSTKKSSGNGEMGMKSNPSADELFSDAVTDFSDNGVGPSLGQGSECVKKLDKKAGEDFVHVLEESRVFKDEKIADTSQPQHGLAQLLQGSLKASDLADSDIMRGEKNQSEIAKSVGDTRNETGVSCTHCPEFNSSQVISDIIVVSDNGATCTEIGKQNDLISFGVGTDIEKKEKGDEAVDIHSTTGKGVLQSEHRVEDIEVKTSEPFAEEATELDKETLGPCVESAFKSKLNNVNDETIMGETVNHEEVLLNDLQFKQDVSFKTEPLKLQDASLGSEVQSDSTRNVIHDNPSQSNEVCDLKESGTESTYLISTAKTSPAEENPKVMIGDFKENKLLKSGDHLDLYAAEEIKSAKNDKKVSVPENLQNAPSNAPAGSIDSSSSDALEGDIEKQCVSAHMGIIGISVLENLPSIISSGPAGSLDEPIEKGVSTAIDGEVCSTVPIISIVDSGVPPQVIPNSSSQKAPDLQNALSNIPSGSAENCSLDALEGDLGKDGILSPIDREVGSSVPENLPSTLSNAPAGMVDNSSLDALEDNLRKQGVSIPIGGEVEGTSVAENLPSTHSNAPAGMVDNSSLDALEDNLRKEGVSIPIGGEVEGTSVAENLPNRLSSVPAGTSNYSSADILEGDLKKQGVSTPVGGEVVGNSVPENLPNPLPVFPAESVDDSLLGAFKDDLKKEDVSTPIPGEVIPSVPAVASADSRPPVGDLDNSPSEALGDHLTEKGISTLIDGDACFSVPGNLPSAISSPPAATVDNSSPEPLKDDLKDEVVSTPRDGEVGVDLENPQSSLSSVSVGSTDSIGSETLKDELVKVDLSTTSDRKVEADDLKKEGVSTPIDMTVHSSGIRITSDGDAHLSLLAGTLPAVENPEAIIGDSKDHKVLKSSFSLDDVAAEDSKSVEDDKQVAVPAERIDTSSSDTLEDGLKIEGITADDIKSAEDDKQVTVPAERINTFSSDASEDDLKKEGVSIAIDGELGSPGFMGISDVDNYLLSLADTSAAVENPEVFIGEFKDYKVLKSSFALDVSAAEVIRSVEIDNRVTIAENFPSALSYAPAGQMDNSGSDSLEDDPKKDGVSIPIDGEIGASEFRVTGDSDLGPSGIGDHLKTSGSKTNNIEPNDNVEGSLPQCVDGKSLQKEDSEPTTWEQSDVIPLKSSTGEQTSQTTNLCGSENTDNHRIGKLTSVASENRYLHSGDEPSASTTTLLTHVEAIPKAIEKPISLAGDQSFGLENCSMGFSSIAGNETVEVAAEESLEKKAHLIHETTEKLIDSASLDGARDSNQVNSDVRDLGKLCNSSESQKCSDDIPHAFEKLKVGEETEVLLSSGTPAVVSQPIYEDHYPSSEKASEDSRSIEIEAFPIESQFLIKSSAGVEDVNTRDLPILGPLVNDGEDKVMKPDLNLLAVDNSIVSSSRTDSLEGNWGSVSGTVLSTQSDVTAAEVSLSTDTQAAKKLDDALKKPGDATMECHHDKSDVFEPPSFMTLVESGVEVDKEAATSEIQTEKRDKQSKCEALQAGWFPSLTNVVNESEGRKKNEEIIAKVTNWNAGKHSPLKDLLNEAHAETKVRSPNTKQVPAVTQVDETTPKNNGAAVTTVGSILGTEMPSADTVKKEMEKEWNSPARYPIQIKKEKRKGKPYWVPFVCCTSVHQDV